MAAASSARAPLRVAVLASGRGSNFEAIATANLPISLVGLFSDKPASRAVALARARAIPDVALDAKKYTDRTAFDRDLFARIAQSQPDLLVLAGFMRVVDNAVIAAWHGRAINIHPSLLPKYTGLRTHQRALEVGRTNARRERAFRHAGTRWRAGDRAGSTRRAR